MGDFCQESFSQNNDSQDDSKFLCVICRQPTIFVCSQCNNAFYCSEQHQQLHWKYHQYECNQSEYSQDTNNIQQNIVKQEQVLLQDLNTFNIQTFSKPNPTVSLQTQENNQQSLRKQVLKLFAENRYSQSLVISKQLTVLSKEIYLQKIELNKNDKSLFYEYLADNLLLVKSFIKSDKIQSAREILIQLSSQVTKNLKTDKIDYDMLKAERANETNIQKLFKQIEKESLIENLTRDIIIQSQKKALLSDELNLQTILYSSMAGLFFAVGDFKNCEFFYVQYVKLIENNFGSDDLQTSNCYFLVGVFYYDHKQFNKALACFQKALTIRTINLGEENEAVADCWYNIGVVYKQIQQCFKAIKYIDKAVSMRRLLIGEISLPIAQAYEMLGKIYFEQQEYTSCFKKFRECYSIRKKILNNLNHPDIINVAKMIMDLQNIIKEKQIEQEQINNKEKDALVQMSTQVFNTFRTNNSSLDKSNEKNYTPIKSIIQPQKSNQNNNFDIPVSKEFIQSLNSNQLLKLTNLKTFIKENHDKIPNFNIIDFTQQSDFVQLLDVSQYNQFMDYIKKSINIYNTN